MSTIVNLVQGSAEWQEHRRKHRNASETPVVLGVSPWTTPYQLWQQKLGLVKPSVNAAMLRGSELEPAARAAYERHTGLVMKPLVLVDGAYSASLDGYTLAGDRIVEIKCPRQGRASSLWQSVQGRCLPEHYQWQVQHQLMVTKADIADVLVFDGAEGIVFPVAPDPSSWPRICAAWDEFARYIAETQPPPLTDRDARIRNDPEWLKAAAEYVELRTAYDELSTKLDDAKERLIELTSHPREQGGRVSVSRFWKHGNINYKLVPELAELDLSKYRGNGREEIRVLIDR
ncbi:MAG: YqaJ viral recombinase family protein [Casimicrobiaceae bacterium]